MGFFSSLVSYLRGRRGAKVICVGLDNSGKTTMLNHLKPDEAKNKTTVVPTIGFTVEMFRHNGGYSCKTLNSGRISFTAYDMSGQGRYREFWEHYYKDVQAIIFVIDSSDKLRMPVVKDELDHLLLNPGETEEVMKSNAPILLLANKMDLKSSMSAVTCSQQLKLDSIGDRAYHICSTNALTGEGLDDAMAWLTDQIKRNDKER